MSTPAFAQFMEKIDTDPKTIWRTAYFGARALALVCGALIARSGAPSATDRISPFVYCPAESGGLTVFEMHVAVYLADKSPFEHSEYLRRVQRACDAGAETAEAWLVAQYEFLADWARSEVARVKGESA